MQLPLSLRRAAVAGALLTTVAATAPAALADTSQNVLVVTTGQSHPYGDSHGQVPFPTTAQQAGVYDLTRYAFDQVKPIDLTPASLAGHDTVLLYGIRWQDPNLSAAAKGAINTFAQTHKVVIWDADSYTVNGTTGVSTYSDFILPINEYGSGEREQKGGEASVVAHALLEPLLSDVAGDPTYINGAALAHMKHTIGDANFVTSFGNDGWQTSLFAMNDVIAPFAPAAGLPIVAWHYGVTGDRTGKVIYSGVGADALDPTKVLAPTQADRNRCTGTAIDMTAAPTCVNWALRLLDVQLQASFRAAADSCAPSCVGPDSGSAPPPPASGGSTPPPGPPAPPAAPSAPAAPAVPANPVVTSQVSATAATCTLAAPAPRRWVRGSIMLKVRTTAASATHAVLATARGLSLGSAGLRNGVFALRVDTRKLPSNRTANVVAAVLSGTARSCSVAVSLRVDNVAPKALKLAVSRAAGKRVVSFRPSEGVQAKVFAGSKLLRSVKLSASNRAALQLPTRDLRLVLVDRAGNRTTRMLHLR